MPFGQIVVGPPGSGKSTYCEGCWQFFSAIGRHSQVVNMDPANDRLSYPCAVDIRDFVTLEEVMEDQNLGPNGGLMYAVESLDASLELFVLQIKSLLVEERAYVVFDCPGQVELFTHHSSLFRIFKKLEKELDLRLCVVNLVDSIHLTSASQYISMVMLSLRTMLMLDLPQINVLSKIDKVQSYGQLPFKLDYYAEVQELEYLQPHVEKETANSPLASKFSKLTQALSEMVTDFNLVSFEVLSIEDKQSMITLQTAIDKANGYIFGTSELGGDTVWAEATRQGTMNSQPDIQDRWVDHKQEYDKVIEQNEKQIAADIAKQETPVNVETDEWETALREWEANQQTGFQR